MDRLSHKYACIEVYYVTASEFRTRLLEAFTMLSAGLSVFIVQRKHSVSHAAATTVAVPVVGFSLPKSSLMFALKNIPGVL
jgi:hypothetical protein